jgi:glycosyltransferase involved in cell wall biosynthesis
MLHARSKDGVVMETDWLAELRSSPSLADPAEMHPGRRQECGRSDYLNPDRRPITERNVHVESEILRSPLSTAVRASSAERRSVTKRSLYRVLMTVDAVGGVWRYAMELALAMRSQGVATVFAGVGPRPSSAQAAEARRLGELVWLDTPLDWMCSTPEPLDDLPDRLARLAEQHRVDLIHLNAPSHAWRLALPVPVLVAAHSCIVTWWQVMHGSTLPARWHWQKARNLEGLERADAVVAPSRSHAELLEFCYGPLSHLNVIHNAVYPTSTAQVKDDFAFAAGRWWDEGKNGRVLDQAALASRWPVRMAGALEGPDHQQFALRHAKHCGDLSAREMRTYLRHAGIVVSPSLYEPFGLVALEAAHIGTPLLLSDIPTHRELWADSAIYFDPHSKSDLTEKLNQLSDSIELRTTMGQRAAERAQLFRPRSQAQAVLQLYHSMISGQPTLSQPRF